MGLDWDWEEGKTYRHQTTEDGLYYFGYEEMTATYEYEYINIWVMKLKKKKPHSSRRRIEETYSHAT